MRSLLFCLLVALVVPMAQAQNPVPADSVETVTEIELRDGSVFIGHILSDADGFLMLRTSAGTEVRIDKSQIVSRRLIRGRVSGNGFRRFDPNQTRLFFAPTGRTLDQGSAYISAYYVFFGFLGYGVTDRFTLAGGTWLIPEAFGELFYIAPKYQVWRQNSNSVSLGVLAGVADGESAGITYAAFTRGQPDQSVTIGLGFAFGDGELSNDPIIVLGGEKQLSRRTKFVAEAYGIPTIVGGAGVLGGIRFFNSNLAADLGLVGAVGDDGGTFVPWVSFAYLFGR